MKITFHNTGYCKQLEALAISGGRWRQQAFPGIFAIMEHPVLGPVLFDTGYSPRFLEATKRLPYALYRWTTPVTLAGERSAAEHVQAAGYSLREVKHIIVSHFHADHVCGLRDFPEATFICSQQAYEAVQPLNGFAAVKKAFLPELLPPDFAKRARWIEQSNEVDLPAKYAPFHKGYDLFNDGSVTAIRLSGHAADQFGLLLQGDTGQELLLGADASWSEAAVRENRPPHALASIVFDNRVEFKETFDRLVELKRRNPELQQVFTHCGETWKRCTAWQGARA
ncbi:MBL fold metallo-hydrolase [Paenibacillus sp. Leaf72]|uniref:MBL fold metallo-hydrolase n=1 Tax=Paenibacillus sp. Leaf72 TaxID=1736234 RepID=UPI0006FCE89F|nr:MBL fold metallo-hydrolase [Paenibacillus sp. Leaf72]KQO07344.1 MBL fold metallo-hydrolase [Paenibacillus sp. Leaf72]